MTKNVARYAIYNGMPGYMPNSHWGAHLATTRRELAALIRDHLDMLDAPAKAFREAKIRNLWRFIVRNGSSSAHFSLDIGNGEYLYFSGLTEEEYEEQNREE
jgi:hypothetical protein